MFSIRKVGNYQKHNASFNLANVRIYKFKQCKCEEYVPEFYTNDTENVNSQIKFWVTEKFPLDVFIQKMKDLIECQERQYINAISGTRHFELAEKFKYLEIRRTWFPMVDKGTNNRHLQQVLNTEVSCIAPTLELKGITINTLEDI